MKNLACVIWLEGGQYVSQCLNVNVSSFGANPNEARDNLREALELYFEDEEVEFTELDDIRIDHLTING